MTGRRLTNAANRIIARLDPAGVRAKREKAQADRFVGVSAAEDGMCRILGSVPAAQGRCRAGHSTPDCGNWRTPCARKIFEPTNSDGPTDCPPSSTVPGT
ncbi:DUF222 domain-containing protein [Rhodococcus opacus]|uniref:DUF222 domain-containing protein n=1 Tax=Rhodococcus opacus TaxID=37919 RepID=UPI0022B23795|nr:DUF222 domain-containing protein [Rhodococcus opacus]